MDTTRICKLCRQPLVVNAGDDICPQCLGKAEIAELAPHFPQLDILQLLGRGGMGMVYKARQPNLNRIVALKILSPDLSGDPAFAERFSREAKALAKLNHPGIVQVYDFGLAGEYYYFVMEYVDGMNFRQLLKSETLAPRQTLELVVQICTALQYAHDEGVVHRDIKPENILLNKKGQVKIADFGVAKLVGHAPETNLTTTQVAMGTLNYMAPEQRKDAQSVDHRADIYSLGVVFYEMLTGEIPMGRFEPPSKRVRVDVRLDEVVLRALEREPAMRYQKASEIKTGVEAITEHPVAGTGSAALPTPRTRPLLDWRLLSGLALLGVAVLLWPRLGGLFSKPGPPQLVERAGEELERYDLPGNIDKAIGNLREATREDPGYTEAHALLGLAYWRLYMQDNNVLYRSEAEHASSNALVLNPDSGFALFVQGLVAMDEGHLDAAKDCLSRANDKFSWDNGEVLMKLASVCSSLNDASNSISYAQKARRVPNKPWYFYNGMAYYEFSRGNIEAAQSNLEFATNIAEDSPKIWLNLGKALVYQGNPAKYEYARKCFIKSLSLYPTDAAFDGLGDLYFTTSNWLDAAATFQKAAKTNPASYDFPGKAGLALIRLPETNYQIRARDLLGEAVDKAQSLLKDRWNPVAESRLGFYQAGLGEATNAYNTLRHAMESITNYPQIADNVDDAATWLETVHHLPGEAAHICQLLKKEADKK